MRLGLAPGKEMTLLFSLAWRHLVEKETGFPSFCFSCCQDLLSGQFNVTLGDKLSEHLKKWIDVGNVLQPPQPVRSAVARST